jgi:thymidylate synthase (FAD)
VDPEFYIPDKDSWRLAPDNRKQGSGGPIDPWTGSLLTQELVDYIKQGEALYAMAMETGVAPEQARLFLPAYGMHVIYRWSCSLQSLALFLQQRLEEDAQKEIQLYAKAVMDLSIDKFPVSLTLLLKK